MIENLGNVGDFIGGIGVVVTLLYLALQIRATRMQTLAEDTTMAVDRWLAAQNSMLQSQEQVSLVRRAYDNYEHLTPEEKGQFSAYMSELNAAYQAAINLNEKGLLDTRQFATIEMAMAGHLACSGSQAWWREIKVLWPEHMSARMDRIVAEYSGQPFNEILSYYRPD